MIRAPGYLCFPARGGNIVQRSAAGRPGNREVRDRRAGALRAPRPRLPIVARRAPRSGRPRLRQGRWPGNLGVEAEEHRQVLRRHPVAAIPRVRSSGWRPTSRTATLAPTGRARAPRSRAARSDRQDRSAHPQALARSARPGSPRQGSAEGIAPDLQRLAARRRPARRPRPRRAPGGPVTTGPPGLDPTQRRPIASSAAIGPLRTSSP
jgi:hypothetical protein